MSSHNLVLQQDDEYQFTEEMKKLLNPVVMKLVNELGKFDYGPEPHGL